MAWEWELRATCQASVLYDALGDSIILLERDVRLVGQLEADGVAAGDARPGDVHEARPLPEARAVQLEPALERLELACAMA